MFNHKSYQFTASLIEVLLYMQQNSPYCILSAFVKSLTGFTITDAVNLEETEPILMIETMNMLEYYEPVSLVHSLSNESDHTCTMKSCPAFWTSGSSDHLGFVAKSPTDALTFLNNSTGKCFLFPDTHTGPDLLCFLQDKETKELILLVLQIKILESLQAEAWLKALESVIP